ncbi:MAG: N-acetyltransferase [Oceanicaulis sp.]|uniref:GNAT family N-acetyltransferase n=1 Tax=Glycocaulis sp. TaxID=1969725 RepID=UPI0025BDF85E|nr:GNAT family N-acetyltransferase [Glycocaulis sp.]MCC5981494.1 N-acetyltransferase [Oceanicaulis sp.]MCH8522422.1 GNAT family N-acetyltransferase [Glycocaulis sp.]
MSVSRVRMIEGLGGVDREVWDRLANPAGAAFDPFLSWDFLQALEQSGCVSEETGWVPRHLIAENVDGEPVGALPLYLKSHSYGEYVFDHAWANALERAGGQYYPKLLTAVPFTPVTGRRVLAADDATRSALVEAAQSLAREWGLSGWHVLFPDERDAKALEAGGLAPRTDIQFIWHNRAYGSYGDFLADLASRKRKALKKEREAAQAGVEIVALTGGELEQEHWDVFFACYLDTGARKWGTPYLNREFFQLIHERMADHVWMVRARREGRWIASALNFIGGEALYGRYWGCLEGHDSLHFELCYHRAIEYAIAHGLKRVEAGAQGHHKLARGYRPTPVGSAHFLTHPGFDGAVRRYLRNEQKAVMAEIASLDADSPFKSGV